MRVRIISDDVADVNATYCTDRSIFRSATAIAQSEKEWGSSNFAHCDIVDCNVFDHAAIHRLQRESTTAFAHAVGNSNVLKPTVRLRAALNSPGDTVFIWSKLLGAPKCAVEESAQIIASHLTIGDRHILRRTRRAKRIGAF